jgi:hypothetical protein
VTGPVLAAIGALALAGTPAPASADWLGYGFDAARTGAAPSSRAPKGLTLLWRVRLRGRITSQVLLAGRTVLVATSAGTVYALDTSGRERWHVRLGRAPTTCPQLDGFGVTGTPAIDPASRTIYLVDAFGRLHALDLVTGRERAGWPLRLYDDPQRELVWGALALVDGALYVPTGSICDRPIEGKVIRVDTATGTAAVWRSVPFELGGGGGIWGWGGVAYSARLGSLLVVTGNARRGGSNDGASFSEAAGYGEQLVELGPDLTVRAASHPGDIDAPLDLDFVGSPVIATRPGCGEVVAATNKNGSLYGWRSDRIAAGPLWGLVLLARSSLPLISQPAWAAATGSFVVASASRLTRIDVKRDCTISVAWSRPAGGLTNSSPTIAGRTVWYVQNGPDTPALKAVDLRSGRTRLRATLPRPGFVAPTIVGARLDVPTMGGDVEAFALR